MTQQHTRSGAFDPADYKVVGILDTHDDPYRYGWVDLDDEYVRGYSLRGGQVLATDAFEAEAAEVEWRCVHCGRRSGMILVAYVRHLPTGDLVMFGSSCVADALADDRTMLRVREAGKAAAIRAARAEWTRQNVYAAAALDTYEADIAAGGEHDTFLDDLSRARRLYGALSDKQGVWCSRALAKRAEWTARKAREAAVLANVPALVEGRREVEGAVVSLKYQDSDYGTTYKMLVAEDDGNRVWGTVPSALEGRIEVDDRVAFTAKVERSEQDEHFGYYSRPTKARYTEHGERDER